jgi:hypothetical protein
MAARYVVLEELGPGRQLIRVASGEQEGAELVLVHRALPGIHRLEEILGDEVDRIDPDRVAETLLVSLLDEQQQAEWDALGHFWVDTEWGRVRLGQLYNIPFRPKGGGALRLCVIPEGHGLLPDCDIWTNLLLVLRGDPKHFFRVANWRWEDGRWQHGPVPLDQLRPPDALSPGDQPVA